MQKRTIAAMALMALLAAPTLALADAVEDVNAAVAALHNNDNDQAIKLLSNAIQSGNLSEDQSASAYYDRGAAYLKRARTTMPSPISPRRSRCANRLILMRAAPSSISRPTRSISPSPI